MEGNVRKFIIIPEHRPLWALGAAFGPKHGPLERPCPVTLDIIGRLLKQSGNEAVTIYEMVKMPNGKFSTPVQLTLDNYTLPYERIVKGETINVNGSSVSDATPPNSMKPNIISSSEPKKEEPQTPSSPKAMFSQLAADSEAESKAALASQIVTTPPVEPAKSDDVEMDETPSAPAVEEPAAPEADPPTEETEKSSEPDTPTEEESSETDVQMESDPYAGMTKAERKAARRAERQAAAQASAQASEE